MKKPKLAEVNGIIFELKYADGYEYNQLKQSIFNSKTLWECYAKPSHIKEEIYINWQDTFLKLETCYFGVVSYNSNFYCLGCLMEIYDKDLGLDGTYPVKITPTHNYLFIAK